MVRGRVVAVNARPVTEADFTEERARRLVEREFNLSYMDTLPAHNAISAGKGTPDGLSGEGGSAQRLGWQVGAPLTLDGGGQTLPAPITPLRRPRWDAMS